MILLKWFVVILLEWFVVILGSLQTILEGSLQTKDVIDGPGCMYYVLVERLDLHTGLIVLKLHWALH